MDIPILPDLVSIFCLSIGVLLVCHKVRIPPIVGFLLTGVLCGPTALGLVEDVHAVEILAEIGVVFLLFTIGMELSGEELARLRKLVFVGGAVQVALTVAAFTGLALLLGHSPEEGVMFGCLAALSSTAIVLSRLQQKAQSESPQGRLTLAVLIFQDIAIVPMMLAIPLLAGKTEADAWSLALSAGRTVMILGGGWLLAKYAVPRIMEQVLHTRSRELMLMTVLGLCLAVAFGTSYLGLSLALGAFLAGLLLAGSEYSLNALEGVLPFKNVFTSLFFISVGMLLDVDFFIEHVGSIVTFAAALILLKILLAVPASLSMGYPLRVAILTAMNLAQIGEFSFVLARSAVSNGLLDEVSYQTFLAASILTMMLTPFIMDAAPNISSVLSRRFHRGVPDESEDLSADETSMKEHLIIVGFGVGGKHLARTAKETGIPYVILEMNPDTVGRFRTTEPIHSGDASRPMVLEHYGIRSARVLAVVISDPTAVRAITVLAHKLNPKIHIVVRTRFLGEAQALKRLGANDVIPEDFETSIEIFTRVLGHYLVPRQTIERYVNSIRSEIYDMARQLSVRGTGLKQTSELLANELLTGLEVVACKVEEGSEITGKRLLETSMRKTHGVTVVGIRRKGEIIPSPGGDEFLHAGDTVFLFASPDALTSAMPLFRAQDE